MAKRNLIIVAVTLLLVGGLFAVVRYTPLFDRYLEQGETGTPPTFAAMAERFHQGERPCLRYFDSHDADPKLAAATALRLADAGWTSREYGDAFGATLEWSLAREEKAHAQDEPEEWYQVFTERLSPTAQLLLRVKGGDTLREKIRRATAIAYGDRIAEGKAALEKLPEDKQRAFRAEWKRHPDAFAISNVLTGLKTLRRHESETRLEQLAAAARADFEANGVLPERIEHISGATPELLVDRWDQPFLYERIWGGVRLSSLGNDRFPGGTGEDEDLIREVLVER